MALREVLAHFGIEVEDGKLKNADKAVEGLTGKLREMATLVGGAAIVGGLKNMVAEVVDFGGNLDDTATKLGLSTGDLQRWRYAAQMSGVDVGAMDATLSKFTRTIGEAADGNKAAEDAFKGLGLEVRDANGNVGSSTDLLLGAARGLAEIEDPSARAKAAIDLFGKSGADLIPLLSQGEEGIQAFLDEADRLGGVLDESTVKQLAEAGDASDRFDFAMRGVKAQIALVFLPILTQAGGKLAELVAHFTQGEGGATHLKAVLATLGAVAFATGVRAALPWLGWALLIAGLVLIVDDLWTGLQGGDSVTGRFLDRVFGKGAGKSIFKSIRDDAEQLWARMREAPSAFGAVEEALSTVGASLVRFFVEDVPAALEIVKQRVADGSASVGEKIVQGILDALGGLGPALIERGQQGAADFISGIIEGIKAGTSRVVGAVGGMAKSAAAELGKAFETGSPSKLAKRVMGYVGDGLVIGAENQRDRVGSAVAGMVAPGTRALAAIGSGAVSRSMTQQNTIHVSIPAASYAAVRSGMTDGLGDAGRAALEALEVGA